MENGGILGWRMEFAESGVDRRVFQCWFVGIVDKERAIDAFEKHMGGKVLHNNLTPIMQNDDLVPHLQIGEIRKVT